MILAHLAILLPLGWTTATAPSAMVAIQEDAPQQIDLQLPEELANRTGPDGIRFEEAVKRVLVYHAGSTQVFQRTVGMLLEGELARRKAAGEDLSWIDLSDAAVEKRLDMSKAKLAEHNPDIDFWDALQSQGYDMPSYVREVKRVLTLDQLFFPDDPDRWPMDLLREIFDTGQEGSMWDFVAEQHQNLTKAKEEGNPGETDETLKELLFRPSALEWLWQNTKILEPFDGLPAGIAMQVGDVQIKTDDLLADVWPKVTPVDQERAAMWVELRWAGLADLEKQGLLLTPAQCKELIEEEKIEYEGSPITYEQVATEFLGFPTMQAYHEHYQLRMSFRQSLPDPLDTETVTKNLEARGSFFGDGRADCEVILCAALNMDLGVFPKEGDSFLEAEKRIRAAAKELSDGAEWREVMSKYSDYKDIVAGVPNGVPQPRKGRFGSLARNPIRDFLGENDYTDYLFGLSIGDAIFFDAEPGKVYGPVRGPFGWYLYKVHRRVAPRNEIDPVNNERHQFIVSDDYITLNFNAYMNGLMSR